VRIEQLALLFALVIAANLVLLIALQLPRLGRRLNRQTRPMDVYQRAGRGAAPESAPEGGAEGTPPLLSGSGGLPAALYQRMSRVVSFMFIGSAMAIVALTGTPNATAIIVLLAFGLILIELFQDVLPASALGRWRLPIEAAVVLIFLTVLIAMTGGHDSPYFFGYILLVGAAALSASGLGAAVLAMVSSIAYISAIFFGSDSAPLADADFGRVAFNLVSISLVMYVASVVGREQRRAREEALRLSRYDSLTRLFSRDYFVSELEQEILRATRTGRPFAVAMLDLDGLKAANDRFGHDWGDQLLKAVADVLHGDIRVTDVAARFGGDEFVLMLPETDLNGAILVADKVRVDISRIALPHNNALVRTSVSIGIVTFPDDGRSSAELMRRADLAMYEAKRRGRDQIVRFAREGAAPLPQAGIVAAPSGAAITQRTGYRYPISSGTADAQAEPVRVPIEIEIQATVPAVREPDPAAQPAVSKRPGAADADEPQSVPAASTGPAPWERR
jgi:diguanylate cyclase (GGDEF)-like protein